MLIATCPLGSKQLSQYSSAFDISERNFYFESFSSDENAKNDLKKLPVIPTYILREHPSIQYWWV